MPDLEKVIRGLEMCSITPSDRVHCHKCPYNNGISIGCMVELMKDALALLREQEPRVIELSEISPNIYVWLEDRDDGTVFPLKGGVIDPDGDDYFRFDADFGEDFVYYPTGPFGKHWRVWDKCPTEEQRQNMPWEGEYDG